MANTIDADLLIDTLSEKVVTYLPERLAPLRAFSKNFSTDELIQQKAVQVPLVTAGSTTLTNPTNFESGDTTTSNVAVTVNHYSQPFHITSAQYNQRFQLEMLAQGNLHKLATSISDINTALILTGTYGTGATVAVASFATSTINTMWAAIELAGPKYLLLDGAAYAKLAPADKNAFNLGESGAYGFDGIFHQSLWTGATANTYGFACSPDAICIAAGIPMQNPGVASEMVAQRTVVVDGIGLPVQVNVWVSRASRALWCSYDVMYGAAAGLAGAGSLLLSA